MQAPPRSIRDADQARVGTVLHDKWTLERLIGVGGMGAVYAAKHRNGAKAAVKIFAPLHETKELRERFLREGYAANKVEHSGAVKVLDDDVIDKGPDAGLAYLVMELLEGESLHDRSQRKPPLTERDLLEVADSVLAVLESAHANGVIHRDLKPDNLFLVKNPDRPERNDIKVLDFGLARLLEKQEQSWNGVAFGTPTFMSPEQAAGKVTDIDGRTDIYALGAILFQLSSKQRIHDAMHTLGLVVRMATTPAPKLRTVAPEISESFAAIVDKALEFNREDRYPTAGAMRAAVQAALASPGAEPSTVNLFHRPAPESARVLAASTLPHDAESPAFGLRKTMPASVESTRDVADDTVGPPSSRLPASRRSLSESGRLPVLPGSSPKLPSPPPPAPKEEPAPGLVTRAEPAVARARAATSSSANVSIPPPGGRVWSPTVVVFAVAVLVGFIAFESRGRIFGGDAPASSESVSSADTSTPEPLSPPPVRPPPSAPSAEPSAEPVAELDEPTDAGEDEEDDDDDDELEAGAPDARAPRVVHPRPSPRPAAKKRPPRRPGVPRRPKRRRWHW